MHFVDYHETKYSSPAGLNNSLCKRWILYEELRRANDEYGRSSIPTKPSNLMHYPSHLRTRLIHHLAHVVRLNRSVILIPLLELGKLVCGQCKEGNDYQCNAAFDSTDNACDVRLPPPVRSARSSVRGLDGSARCLNART